MAPRVTNHGSTSTVELDDADLPGGKADKGASATLTHISDLSVKPAHNGGFVITVSKKSKPSRGGMPSYQEPETYALEDGQGLCQFFEGLVAGDTAKDAAYGGGKSKPEGDSADSGDADAAGGEDKATADDAGADTDDESKEPSADDESDDDE